MSIILKNNSQLYLFEQKWFYFKRDFDKKTFSPFLQTCFAAKPFVYYLTPNNMFSF